MSGKSLHLYAGQKLKEREVDVWRRFSMSETTKEAASNMGLSPKTVEWYRLCLMNKLKCHDYAGLTRLAYKHGLISL